MFMNGLNTESGTGGMATVSASSAIPVAGRHSLLPSARSHTEGASLPPDSNPVSGAPGPRGLCLAALLLGEGAAGCPAAGKVKEGAPATGPGLDHLVGQVIGDY